MARCSPGYSRFIPYNTQCANTTPCPAYSSALAHAYCIYMYYTMGTKYTWLLSWGEGGGAMVPVLICIAQFSTLVAI